MLGDVYKLFWGAIFLNLFYFRSSSNYINIHFSFNYLPKLWIKWIFFLHRCCEQLLVGRKKQPLSDQAEDLECLCHLIRTCGKNLDSTVGKVHYLVQRFVWSSPGFFFHEEWISFVYPIFNPKKYILKPKLTFFAILF